jgi:hypothetical protein
VGVGTIAQVLRRRRPNEPPLTWSDVNAIVEALMRIDAKLDEILAILGDDGDEETEEQADD